MQILGIKKNLCHGHPHWYSKYNKIFLIHLKTGISTTKELPGIKKRKSSKTFFASAGLGKTEALICSLSHNAFPAQPYTGKADDGFLFRGLLRKQVKKVFCLQQPRQVSTYLPTKELACLFTLSFNVEDVLNEMKGWLSRQQVSKAGRGATNLHTTISLNN